MSPTLIYFFAILTLFKKVFLEVLLLIFKFIVFLLSVIFFGWVLDSVINLFKSILHLLNKFLEFFFEL